MVQQEFCFVPQGMSRPEIFQLTFLGAFAKLRKSAISIVMSVSPSVRMEQLGSDWRNFSGILYLGFFENLSRKFKFH
jgi:hypothetical protein